MKNLGLLLLISFFANLSSAKENLNLGELRNYCQQIEESISADSMDSSQIMCLFEWQSLAAQRAQTGVLAVPQDIGRGIIDNNRRRPNNEGEEGRRNSGGQNNYNLENQNIGINHINWGTSADPVGPLVGMATRLLPVPQGRTVINSKIEFVPGDIGGPSLIRNQKCGSNAYQVEIPKDVIYGNWTLLRMRPGYSMSYLFNPRQMQINGMGRWIFAEHQSAGAPANVIASISEEACDWQENENPCQNLATYGYYIVDGMIGAEHYQRNTGVNNFCILNPNKNYYLNVKWGNKSSFYNDDCFDRYHKDQLCATVVSP